MAKGKATTVGPVSNGAEETIDASRPYYMDVTIEGIVPLLMHRYSVEAVDAKNKAAKGSAAKKSDDLESFVYRDEAGELCIPGVAIRGAIVTAAKFEQDPRSPRKSMMDLAKAGVDCITELASLGVNKWELEDKRRVLVQRNAVSRTRPGMKTGWRVSFRLMIVLPQYFTPEIVRKLLTNAGKMVGVGDFRPSYGRFDVVSVDVVSLD